MLLWMDRGMREFNRSCPESVRVADWTLFMVLKERSEVALLTGMVYNSLTNWNVLGKDTFYLHNNTDNVRDVSRWGF